MRKNYVLNYFLLFVLIVSMQQLNAQNLLGYWKFDETSGTVAADASSNGYDFPMINIADSNWVTGKFGNSILLNGVDGDATSQYGMLDSTTSVNFKVQSVTIAAWIKHGPDFNVDCCGDWVAGFADSYGLFVNANTWDEPQGITFYFHNADDWPGLTGGDLAAIADDQWHFISGTLDGESGIISLYVDGKVVASDSISTDDIVFDTGNEFTVGTMAGERNFGGNIDELRVYDYALNEYEIAALMDSTLVASYSFEGSGFDASGHGRNLTMVNTADSNWVPGYLGTGVEFNGVDATPDVSQYATLDSATSVPFKLQSLTLTAWIKHGPDFNVDCCGDWIVGFADSYGLYLNSNDWGDPQGLNFYIHTEGDWEGPIDMNLGDYTDNQWHFVAATFDGETGEAKIYRDGNCVKTDTLGKPIVYDTGNEFNIGSMSGERNYGGSIDEVKVFSRALTDAEIKNMVPFSTHKLRVNIEGSGDVAFENIQPIVDYFDNGNNGMFLDSSTVTLRALPAADYVFIGWTGDTVSSVDTLNLLITSNMEVTANFIEGSMLAHWNLDETADTIAKDASAYHHDIPFMGGITSENWVDGVDGGSLELNGAQSGELDATISAVFETESITVSAWVKTTKNDDWQWIAGSGDNYGLYLTNTGHLTFYIHSAADWEGPEGRVALNDGQWHHVAGTFNSETNEIIIYADGFATDTITAFGPIVYSEGSRLFHVGSMDNERNLTGSLDDIYVYKSALNESEIQNLIKSYSNMLTTTAENGLIVPTKGYYAPDAEISVEAKPDQGYKFKVWGGELFGVTDNPTTVVIGKKNTKISAEFEKADAIAENSLNNQVQVYPNPFSNQLAINYNVKGTSHVSITVLDLSGKVINILVNENQTGKQTVSWSGTNLEGNSVADGVYFIRLQIGAKSALKQVIHRK